MGRRAVLQGEPCPVFDLKKKFHASI